MISKPEEHTNSFKSSEKSYLSQECTCTYPTQIYLMVVLPTIPQKPFLTHNGTEIVYIFHYNIREQEKQRLKLVEMFILNNDSWGVHLC